MSEITCPYCSAEDDDCQSDLWELEGDDNEIECNSCKKTIIVSAEVTVNYNVKRQDCDNDKHEYGEWYRFDYDVEGYSLWCRDCKHCDDSDIVKTEYKADLPENSNETND